MKINLLSIPNLSTRLSIPCSQNPTTDWWNRANLRKKHASLLPFLPASATCHCWKQSQATSYTFLWSLWDYLFSQLLLELMHMQSLNVSNAWPVWLIGKVRGTKLAPSLCSLNSDLLSKTSFHSDNIFVLVAYRYSLQPKAHKTRLSWAVKNPWWQAVFCCFSTKLHTRKQKSLETTKYKHSWRGGKFSKG